MIPGCGWQSLMHGEFLGYQLSWRLRKWNINLDLKISLLYESTDIIDKISARTKA
jgi:hypothetical protein